MADVTINYEGNAIATMSASGTKTLLTEGKYCTDDIEVVYVSPGGGINTVTINSEPTTIQGAYEALQTAIGNTTGAFVAWVPYDAAYYGANQNVVCVVGAPDISQGSVWRSDNSYSNFRKFAASSSNTVGEVPSGTVFNYCVIF